jgi:hypothetical protein
VSTEATKPDPTPDAKADAKPAAKPAPQPAPKPEAHANPAVVTATIGAVVAVGLLALFLMFTEPAYRGEALPSFIGMIVIVTGALIAATAWPRATGHLLAGLFGLASLLTGLFTITGSAIPFALALVLVIMGAGGLIMTLQSYQRRSRPAWAFLAALLGVMGVCTLFGAPKIRNLIGTTMWIALTIPGLLTVTCVALGMIANDYREKLTPRR